MPRHTGMSRHFADMRFTSAASDPAVRKKWEDFAAANGPEALHRELAQRDPASAARLQTAHSVFGMREGKMLVFEEDA